MQELLEERSCQIILRVNTLKDYYVSCLGLMKFQKPFSHKCQISLHHGSLYLSSNLLCYRLQGTISILFSASSVLIRA